MKKIVLTFGLISGVMIAVLTASSLLLGDHLSYGQKMAAGYTIMVASFLMVYFGIRSYRDNVLGGRIGFGRAVAVGAMISAITCLFYVGMWEVMYFKFMPDYLDKYAAHTVETMRTKGASQAAIDAKTEEMRKFKENYNNPIYNAAVTVMEPLPVAILLTLISAAMLRKKEPEGATGETVAA